MNGTSIGCGRDGGAGGGGEAIMSMNKHFKDEWKKKFGRFFFACDAVMMKIAYNLFVSHFHLPILF